MAAVRQLAGERKGLGSGAQSARQANSARGRKAISTPSRRRRRRRDSCGGCAVDAAAALAVGPRAPRGGCGRRRRWCDGRTIGGRRAARRRRPRARRCGALAALARSLRRRRFVEGENGPSEAPRSESAELKSARALFPPLKAPQRDVRATTRRHSAAVCPRDGPATPTARPRANNILSHTARSF